MILPVVVTTVLCFEGTNLDTDAATLRVGAWLPRLGGSIASGGGAIDLESNIDLRHRENTLLAEFELQNAQNDDDDEHILR